MAKARSQKPTLDPDQDFAHRLQLHGPKSLTDAELLALIADLGLPEAQEILKASGGLARLRHSVETAFPASAVASARLRACLELSQRILRARLPKRILLNRPSLVARYLIAKYSQPEQEVAGAVFLDSKSRLIEDAELFRGTRHRCDISPEPFLRHALLIGARGIIAFHTHPSGDVTPSAADVAFTGRLVEACDVVGFMLVDHLILGGVGEWVSMRGEGRMETE